MTENQAKNDWRSEPVTLMQWWRWFTVTCLLVGMIAGGFGGLLAMTLALVSIWLVRFPLAWIITRQERGE